MLFSVKRIVVPEKFLELLPYQNVPSTLTFVFLVMLNNLRHSDTSTIAFSPFFFNRDPFNFDRDTNRFWSWTNTKYVEGVGRVSRIILHYSPPQTRFINSWLNTSLYIYNQSYFFFFGILILFSVEFFCTIKKSQHKVSKETWKLN